MKLKKIFAVAMLSLAGIAAFASPFDPKEGYFKLKWGASVEDARKAGYKLSEVEGIDKEKMPEMYDDGVTAYYANSKDKTPSSVNFYFYMGHLFQVTENIPENKSSKENLEKRYGKFSENGIFELGGGQYTKVELDADGQIKAVWLMISKNPSGDVVSSFMDWNIFKNVCVVGRQMSGNSEAGGFVSELADLAEKLVQQSDSKPTYAFMALTSDDGNSLVENYVTDALTEAMFNTGKIKIVERSSIEKILNEQQFQDSALVNENTASQIGNLTGANYVCYGTVKDLGEQVTLNVKVVEVSTAELCAMGRETVGKDEYLKNVGFEARKTGSRKKAEKQNTSVAKTTKSVEDNKWTYTSTVNDFDGYTEFIFTLLGADNRRIAVIYQRNNDKYKSRVISGIIASFNDADIKCDDGSITKIHSSGNYYYKENGKSYRLDIQNSKKSGRDWLKIFMSNEHIVFRANDIVTHFQTAGLMEKMEEAGITWEELDSAMKNQEF